MAHLVGEKGRVYAFEALSENARLLVENVTLNGYENRIFVENKAITDGVQAIVTLDASHSSFESRVVNNEVVSIGQSIPAISLDQYFPEGQTLDFEKMDIEGGEVAAVKGMERLLSERKLILLVEIHASGKAAANYLAKASYSFQDLDGIPVEVENESSNINHCIALPPIS